VTFFERCSLHEIYPLSKRAKPTKLHRQSSPPPGEMLRNVIVTLEKGYHIQGTIRLALKCNCRTRLQGRNYPALTIFRLPLAPSPCERL
jgi:hypothetical protein